MNLIENYGYYLALLVRGIATIILVFQIIPLQFKEAQVKNGLGKLRKQLLIVGFTLLFTNLLAMILIHTARNTTEGMSIVIQIINAFALLILSFILYLIYHEQYAPEAKEIRRQVEIVQNKKKNKSK